jgi:hypothetical protein
VQLCPCVSPLSVSLTLPLATLLWRPPDSRPLNVNGKPPRGRLRPAVDAGAQSGDGAVTITDNPGPC